MRTCRLVVAVLLVCLAAAAGAALHAAPAQESVLLRAMREELERSMAGFRASPEPPYFVSFAVTEERTFHVGASYGAIQQSSDDRRRLFDVDVRVGDYELDSTRRLRGDQFSFAFDFPDPEPLPLEDDPAAIQAKIWIETDRAYRKALEKFTQVKANRAVMVREEDPSDDFSREAAVRSIGAPVSIAPDPARWEARVRDWSALFRKHGEILESNVAVIASATNKYFVNSEGTVLQHGNVHWRLWISAETKADDGMELFLYDSFDASEPGGLPDDRAVQAAIERIARDLLALRKAPTVEPYTGPAILSGRAAGVFFHEIFGHRIEGHRQKDEEEGQTFTKKVGQPILPAFLSVHDDPTRSRAGSVDLNGHYPFDDEGVPAQRVAVIENGVLRNFLMSRSPVAGFAKSNGHGRSAPGYKPVGRQGNLIVETSSPVSREGLRELLIEECRKQGKPFGLFFDDIAGGFTFTGRATPQAFQVTPLLVYRVFTDGRPDELVRGVDLIGTPLVAFSKILAASQETEVFNGYCGAESGSVPVSAVSPALLTAEIEIQKKEKSAERPPLLPPATAEPAPDLAEVPGIPADDTLLRALRTELKRTAERLKLDNGSKPYFVGYSVADLEARSVEASFGAVVASERTRMRPLLADVRVGSYDFDNSGFVGSRGMFGAFARSAELVTEDDFDALRQDLWLASDHAYKQAVELLASKKAFTQNKLQKEPLPDLSREQPLVALAARATPPPDARQLEDLARRLSLVFREYPAIAASGVRLRVASGTRYVVNSEGTVTRQPETIAALVAHARTQASDGMALRHHLSFLAPALDALPPDAELLAAIRKMAIELTALRNAPVMEQYLGPVLVTGAAAPDIVALGFAPHLSGQRPPLFEEERMASSMGKSDLAERLNRRVLPPFLSIVDDPAVSELGGVPLVGALAVDDEGVKAQPLTLVENGVLRGLLMSRRPRKEITQSNGHARSTGIAAADPRPTTTIVRASGARGLAALKTELIELCRTQGLGHGLLLRALDDPAITGTDEDAFFFGRRGAKNALPAPVLAYRVSVADGSEELVRGLEFGEVTVRNFKDILAAGDDPQLLQRFAGAPVGFGSFFMGGGGGGGLDGIPISVVTPSLLFEELELQPASGPQRRPPLLPHPFFAR